MKQKKTEDSSFGEQSTTLETLESRGMSTDNYEKILVRKAGDKTSVYIVEKKRLSGFKLCGTLDNLTITKGNECELYELNASITEFNGKEEYEYYDVKPTIDGYVVVGFDYVKKNAVIIKFDSNKNIVWKTNYGKISTLKTTLYATHFLGVDVASD